MQRLRALGPALALAVTTVIGGGALALPGVALDGAGNDALLGWGLSSASAGAWADGSQVWPYRRSRGRP